MKFVLKGFAEARHRNGRLHLIGGAKRQRLRDVLLTAGVLAAIVEAEVPYEIRIERILGARPVNDVPKLLEWALIGQTKIATRFSNCDGNRNLTCPLLPIEIYNDR
jgi:hypothetical protein